MRKYKRVDTKILETINFYLLQAFNVLSEKKRPERYKLDFAMARINSVMSCINNYYLNTERSEKC